MTKILVTSHQNTKKNQGNPWLEHIPQSRNWIYSRKWSHSEDSTTLWWVNILVQVRRFDRRLVGPHSARRNKTWTSTEDRLVGDAEMRKRLLNREPMRTTDGVKYFRNTLRPHFIKGAYNVFLWRFYQFNRARRGSLEMVKWISKFSLSLQRFKDAWMDKTTCRCPH